MSCIQKPSNPVSFWDRVFETLFLQLWSGDYRAYLTVFGRCAKGFPCAGKCAGRKPAARTGDYSVIAFIPDHTVKRVKTSKQGLKWMFPKTCTSTSRNIKKGQGQICVSIAFLLPSGFPLSISSRTHLDQDSLWCTKQLLMQAKETETNLWESHRLAIPNP